MAKKKKAKKKADKISYLGDKAKYSLQQVSVSSYEERIVSGDGKLIAVFSSSLTDNEKKEFMDRLNG